jgi:hypothetical protein
MAYLDLSNGIPEIVPSQALRTPHGERRLAGTDRLAPVTHAVPRSFASSSLCGSDENARPESCFDRKDITMKPEEQGKKNEGGNELTDKELDGVAGGAVDMFTPNPGGAVGIQDNGFRPAGGDVGIQDNSFRPAGAGGTAIDSFSKPGKLGGKL